MQRQTSTPIRRQTRIPYALAGVAAAGVIGTLGLVGLSTEQDKPEPWGTVNATDGDPAVAYPVMSAPSAEKPLRLRLIDMTLPDVAKRYREVSLIVPMCPLCVGIDKPAIPMTENERTIFAALIGSESNWNPYDEYGNLKVSSAGCLGVSQLCFGLATEENLRSPEASLYAAAAYFNDLIDQHQDVTIAIAAYKGALIDGVVTHPAQVASVWQYVGVEGN